MKRALEPLTPPASPPVRLTSRPLPAYRHVPGLTPHPVNHPAGHSYGAAEIVIPPGSLELPEHWYDCEAYLFGVDLFNQAYFWEAHEAWEAIWHAVGHESLPGRFIQSLIQVSAALLKRHMEIDTGAHRLLAKAFAKLDLVEDWMMEAGQRSGAYMGLEVPAWRMAVRNFLDRRACEFPFIRLEALPSSSSQDSPA